MLNAAAANDGWPRPARRPWWWWLALGIGLAWVIGHGWAIYRVVEGWPR